MFGRSRKEKAQRTIAAIAGGDVSTVLNVITDDFVFVDSKEVELKGRAAFARFLEKFKSLDLGVKIDHGALGVSGDQILMSGNQTAYDDRLCCRIQWQITFRRGRICRIQTFRGDELVSIIRIVENHAHEISPAEMVREASRQSA